MNVSVRRYNHTNDYADLMEIIKSEGDEWKDYFDPKYQMVLEQSITYVAYINKKCCGYSRSINDCGLYIWVIDLLVHKEYRGNSIGKKLMEVLLIDFPDQDVYVLSDVNEYYEKLGYKKEGSVFKVG